MSREEVTHGLIAEDAVGQETRMTSQLGFKRPIALAAGLMLAVVATAAATTRITVKMMLGDEHSTTGLDGMMVVKTPNQFCAKGAEDCLSPGCCAVSGYNCFKVAQGKARCMQECTPGGMNGTCEGASPPMKPVDIYEPGLSLFCFAVYTENTGISKPSQELELLQRQHDQGVSLFSCAEWAVYADVVAPLGGGDMTVQVNDVKGDFHIMRRPETKCWVNTGMFVQVWSAIHSAGRYAAHDWVIKVDADAVFFPHKLLNVLKKTWVPKEGVYLTNCKFVDWGYFGNLEVFSKQAFETVVRNLEQCYTSIPWKIGVKGGKYGPMGEDLFAQTCMDQLGVAQVENWDLTTDGACEADRPKGEEKNKKYIPNCVGTSTPSIHPFKKPDAYLKCHAEASAASNGPIQ